jgi:hypothetical protein
MPSLHELQAGFAAAVFDAGSSARTPGIRANGLSPAVRLGFYRTNVFENYRKALQSVYPAVCQRVGRADFLELADAYIRRHRSDSADVGAHARQFPAYLARHPLAGAHPWLPDLARLEWAIEEAFFEADHSPLALQALAEVDPALYPVLRFVLAPSARLLESAFPVHRMWQASQAALAATAEDPAGEPVRLVVWRQRYDVAVDPLPAADFAMLHALHRGYAFSEAFEYALVMDAAFDVSAFLQRHVAAGLLCGFAVGDEVTDA